MKTDIFDKGLAIAVSISTGASFGGWQNSAAAGAFMMSVCFLFVVLFMSDRKR